MTPDHLSPEALRRLLERDNDEEQNLLLLHHLEVCPECGKVGGHIAALYRAGALDLRFSVVDVDLALSRMEAPRLWEELRGLERRELEARVDSGRFTTWGMVELLCAESLGVVDADPDLAVELACLAVWISWRIEEWKPAEKSWMTELRAYALAHLGHAWSRKGERFEAECAFVIAREWWLSVAGDIGDVLGYESRILELCGRRMEG